MSRNSNNKVKIPVLLLIRLNIFSNQVLLTDMISANFGLRKQYKEDSVCLQYLIFYSNWKEYTPSTHSSVISFIVIVHPKIKLIYIDCK